MRCIEIRSKRDHAFARTLCILGRSLAQILHLSRKTLDAVNRPLPEHQVLHSKIRIATCLENTTKLERPRNSALSKEEERHLHGITQQPVCKNTQAEPFATAVSLIRHDLRKRQCSFDTQSHVTLKCNVGIQAAEQNLENQQGCAEVRQEHPVGLCLLPLPKVEGSLDVRIAFSGSCEWLMEVVGGACEWTVLQSDSKEDKLYNHHQTSLQEKRQIKACSKPVEQSTNHC